MSRNSRFNRIYWAIHARCTNPKQRTYKYYGAIGIQNRWHTFAAFKRDMYASYMRHVAKYGELHTTLERRDVAKHYTKENCYWTTRTAQARNRRTNFHITYRGKTRTLAEWAERTGIHKNTLRDRLVILGWSTRKALTTGIIIKRKNKSIK